MNTIPATKVVEWKDRNLFDIRTVTWVLPEVRLVIQQSRAQIRRDNRQDVRNAQRTVT